MLELPYFDALLNQLQQHNPAVERAFGTHVHWGYWPDPVAATPSPESFAQAAERLTLELCRLAAIEDGQRVLDAGCGFGGTVASINQRQSGMEIVGLNIDPRQLARARHTVDARSGNRIHFIPGDACALPFDDDFFDAVTAVECIFHFPDRRRFFEEACRVLKPGGRLALSDFVPIALFAPATVWSARRPAGNGFYGRCDLQCTANGYRRLAEETGLLLETNRDITTQTLPTYTFLRKLSGELEMTSLSAIVETGIAEWTSRLRLLRYMLFAFRKAPQNAPTGVHTQPPSS